MRNLFIAGLAVASALVFAPPVSAASSADINQAISLCRTTVAQQAGVDVNHARFQQVRERAGSVLVGIQLWRSGHLTNVTCEVAPGDTPSVASITPALTTATAQR